MYSGVYSDSGIRFGSKGGFNIIDIASTGKTTFHEDVEFTGAQEETRCTTTTRRLYTEHTQQSSAAPTLT